LKGRYAAKRERQKSQNPPALTSQAKISPTEHTPESKPEKDNTTALKNPKIISRPSGVEVVGYVGLFLSLVIAAIYGGQLIVMNNQLTEMAAQRRLSVRPWIGLDEGKNAIQTTPLQIDKEGNASLVYKIVAKNYGSTPAANVWAMANLVVADDLNTVYEQQGYACGDAVIGKPDIGLVLFQGRDRQFTSYPSTTKISLKHEKSQIGIWLAGCIGYRDQFGYLCRTKFIWGFQDESGRPVSLYAPVPAMTIKGSFFATASGEGIDSCQIPKYK
jgi:hypothetical protein